MKKLLPYILIFVIIANIFAPFSIVFDQKTHQPKIEQNTASAYAIQISVFSPTFTTTDTTIKVFYRVGFDVLDSTTNEYLYVELKNPAATDVSKETFVQKIPTKVTPADKDKGILGMMTGEYTFTGLKPNTQYDVRAVVTQGDSVDFGKPISSLINIVGNNIFGIDVGSEEFELKLEKVTTNTAGNTGGVTTKGAAQSNGDVLPPCGFLPGDGGTITGCAVQLLYYAVFVPTSYVFGLAGKFFDWAFAYSITDESYRSSFVVEGWGVVRDVCNLFFIFILIYAAFGMILSIHSIKAKEIIVNVVIIGLLINFSLFVSQILVDASNILTRVFYNSETISISVNGNKPVTKGGLNIIENTELGEIALSAGIVNKVNPQNIILEAQNVNLQDDAGVTGGSSVMAMSASSYLLILIFAIAVNLVGLYVFFMLGLLFVGRVVGLWFAMIFVPFAFFSYTVPKLQEVDHVGWKKWWPETLGLCFMAPIFMFFMYLILTFMNVGFNGIIKADTGPNWLLGILIPFIFIIILLLTAKKLAVKYAGEVGGMAIKAGTVLGGVALGGAALSGAFLGRKIIGGGLAKAASTDESLHLAKHQLKIEEWKAKGKVGPKPTISQTMENGKTYRPGMFTGIGAALNKAKERVSMVDHARHEYDAAKEKAGLKNVPDSMLTAYDKKKIELELKKSKKSDVESAVRKGEDLKGNKTKDRTGNEELLSEEKFKSKKRAEVIQTMQTRNPADKDYDANDFVKNKRTGAVTSELSDAGKKKVENELNLKFNEYSKAEVAHMLDKTFKHIKEEAAGVINGTKVTQFERTGSKANTGTWDMRNISDSKTDKRAGILTKLGVGAVATIALAVRTGLKSTTNIDHGKGQGEFLKDLKETVSTAIKTAKIKVEVPHSSGGGGHDDHGGGHDDHGGGGGHH